MQITTRNMGPENIGISRQFRVDSGCFAPALPPAPSAPWLTRVSTTSNLRDWGAGKDREIVVTRDS